MILLLAACKADPTLPPIGSPLWADVDLSEAIDLGHEPTEGDPLDTVPLRFVDVTVEVGLGDAFGGGNQHGVGIALVDVDGNGWDDLIIANGVSNTTGTRYASQLWLNDEGSFTDGSDRLPLGGTDLYSVAAGDIDGDGDADLYFGGQPRNVLLRNDGAEFTDITRSANAAGPASDASKVADGRSKVVNIDDFDGDGLLDLSSASSTLPKPGATLLRNRGNGTFGDITAASNIGIASAGHPCAVQWTDYDNDGNRDLWIWNDRGSHTLLHHDGEAFEDFGTRADDADPVHPMGIDSADIDGDGDLDYYISNIGHHPLLRNNGDGTFTDISAATGTVGDYGWGLAFEDFDHDGDPDIYVTQEDDRDVLAWQNEALSFTMSSWPRTSPLDTQAAHNVAAAFGDIDGDGRTDAISAGTDGSRVTVHRNATNTDAHWLEVRVPDGVGARVAVFTGDVLQFRDVSGGSSRASQNALSARFGLGAWDGADQVVVLWPDGRQRVWTNVPADERLELSAR